MRHPVTTYAIAIAALAAAVLLRWLLDPLMGGALPLVTLFGAVAAAAWVGGYRPGVIVAILGYAFCNYLFIEPRGAIGPFDVQNMIGLVAYTFTCALIIGIGEAMRVAQLRASQHGDLMRLAVPDCPYECVEQVHLVWRPATASGWLAGLMASL